MLVGVDRLKASLSRLMWAIRVIEKLTSQYLSEVRQALSGEEAALLRRAYFGRVASVLRKIRKELEFLEDARKKLRALPDVDPEAPTIVVAAAPNVGKSTLVHAVSSAKPEIASYPFTTKGLILGHIELNQWQRVQIVDTPGLLDRPLSERNQIEQQAIAALKHLADVIIFLIDPTMHSGFTLDYQLRVLREIRGLFKEYPILVALNKIDIANEEEVRRAKEALAREGIERVYEISAQEGRGLKELMDDALKLALARRRARASS